MMRGEGDVQEQMVEISVVIPAYNREGTIGRCIESVLVQDFPSFEIVVADDGSTDRTRSIVHAFNDPRVRLAVREANGGASAARNAGIAAARGKYVALLDSDDVFLPGKLREQHRALVQAGPDCRISCTAYRIELIDQGQIIDGFHAPASAEFEGLYRGCGLSPGSTLMAERSVFDEIGTFDTSLRRFEDWEWLLRYVARGGRIVLVNTILSHIYNRRGRLAWDTWTAAEQFIARRDSAFPGVANGLRREANFLLWAQVAGTAYFARDYPVLVRSTARAVAADWRATLRRAVSFARGRNAQADALAAPVAITRQNDPVRRSDRGSRR